VRTNAHGLAVMFASALISTKATPGVNLDTNRLTHAYWHAGQA
jgi:hypothetical protein